MNYILSQVVNLLRRGVVNLNRHEVVRFNRREVVNLTGACIVEQIYAMFLNRANKVLAIFQMSSGGISGTVADPRLLFVAALKIGATSFILAHNHPSENKTASEADIKMTKKIKFGGELLEIKLLDHLIITKTEGYYSMAEDGVI